MGKKRILIIDDVRIVCVAVRMELQENGYDCDIALNLAAALEKVKLNKYDIVLIDLLMDDISGVEMCKIIKKELPKAIMILMTGYVGGGLDNIIRDFVKAGGSKRYLLKPFQPGEIFTVINESLLV